MNSKFNFEDTTFDGVKIITPFYLEDNRGYFLKSIEKDIYKSMGLNVDIFEEFESYSNKDVVRGLHFQTKNPQVKIVRAVVGSVLDVVVDLRKGSKTFGKWLAFELSDTNHKMLWIPAGFAHGFKVISEYALMSYKCIGKYEKEFDTGIVWNDKDINIEWNVKNPIISERDSKLITFKQFVQEYEGL